MGVVNVGQRLITLPELMAALTCTDKNIYEREGKSLPMAASQRPRVYRLIEVLWMVGGQDRELICRKLGISVAELKNDMRRSVENNGGGYIPAPPSEGDDERGDVAMF